MQIRTRLVREWQTAESYMKLREDSPLAIAASDKSTREENPPEDPIAVIQAILRSGAIQMALSACMYKICQMLVLWYLSVQQVELDSRATFDSRLFFWIMSIKSRILSS